MIEEKTHVIYVASAQKPTFWLHLNKYNICHKCAHYTESESKELFDIAQKVIGSRKKK